MSKLREPDPKRRLKVIHVIDDLGPGGAETLVFRLLKQPSDIEHEVVCLGSRDWYSEPIERMGIRVHHLRKTSYLAAPGAIAELGRIIDRSRASLVQGWLYRSNLLASVASRRAGTPVVWGIHCASLDALGFLSRMTVRASGKVAPLLADFIINCSERSAAVHAKLGYARVSGAIVHNGYDPVEFQPDDQARLVTRQSLGIARDRFLIGTITRWHAQKDIPNLLKALRIASRRGVPVHCLLIGLGMGPRGEALTDAIMRYGCEGLVVRLGERSDVADLARALDLHVLASGTEAFPNVVAETMLSAVPNVVTDVGDSAAIVGTTGWVVPPRNAEALADAIVQAYQEWRDDGPKWAARKIDARERIVARFTLDRMAEAYERIWREVVDEHDSN